MFVEFAESPAFAALQEIERRVDYLIALRRAEVRVGVKFRVCSTGWMGRRLCGVVS